MFPLPRTAPDANLNTAAFDGDGILWFTGQAGIYGRLDPADGTVEAFDAPRGRGPYGITATPAGDVYYASLAGSHIARIDRETGEATVDRPADGRPGRPPRLVRLDAAASGSASGTPARSASTTRRPAPGRSGRCPATTRRPTPSTSTTQITSG